jgi:hypothetical protein
VFFGLILREYSGLVTKKTKPIKANRLKATRLFA